ncbi:calmodulin-binding protein 60 B-like [Eucalyptus grandis]|uniref:calmodulin-binding protein 60 B-like n=1 Tax=Eucalyptus grandis TaxID=71139 RepID=UPI00192EFABA|nr:calmodulin-binding protein 60 B-like [Eucalyptus grandis]
MYQVLFFQELGDTIVQRANWNDIREFNGETFSVSMPKKSSSSFPSQVLGGQTDNLTPRIFASPVGLEAPPANAVSTAEGYNDSISTRYQMQPLCVNANIPLQVDGSSFPLQNPLISSSHQTQLLSFGPSQASASGFHAAGPSSLPPCRGAEELFLEEEIRMRSHEMLENEDMQHLPRTFNMGGHNQSSFNATEDGYQFSSACMPNLSQNFGFKQNRSRSFGEADVGWLKIKAVMRWGFFVRKKAAERRAQLRELDETETRNEDEAELAFMFICSSPSLPDSCQF